MTQHCSFTPSNAFAADAITRCERVLSDLITLLGNLGGLVAIDVDGVGRVTLTAGHSDLERTREVAPDDIFQIGSQTKTIIAMTLFLLARDGKLDLDDPVSRFLDIPIDRRITVRHLLMNASGLGEYTFAIFNALADPRIRYTPRDLVALALPQGQVFEPGKQFDYSNTNFIIAGMVIEAITGKGYGEVVADRILQPLGLSRSGFGGIVPAGERMLCYMKVLVAPEPIETSALLSWGYGAGDGLCSAGDVLAIYQSLMRPDSPLGITLDDLTRETKKPSAKPYFPLSLGTEYGLGLERRAWAGAEVWGHPGSTLASRSSTWIDAERGVSVATALTDNVDVTAAFSELRYPRAQLFAMALDTAYALAAERR